MSHLNSEKVTLIPESKNRKIVFREIYATVTKHADHYCDNQFTCD